MDNRELKEFFAGRKLYGNNFSLQEIQRWFADEEESYFNLVSNFYLMTK